MKRKIVKRTFTFEEATLSEKRAILDLEKREKELHERVLEKLRKGKYDIK